MNNKITQEQIDNIVNRIVKNTKPKKVILFGSYAYGEPTKDSDVDLLVVKNTDEPRFKRGREIRKHLRGLKIPIDIVVYNEKEIDEWKDIKASFISHVIKKGKVLYG